MGDGFAMRLILGCAALLVGASAADAASITDTLKKFGNPGAAAPPGKAPAPPPAKAPAVEPPATKSDRRVLAQAGDWILVHAPAWWSTLEQRKIAACSAYTRANDALDETKTSIVWFTRWERSPKFAEFSVSPGPSVENPSLVVVGGAERLLKIGQGTAFLKDEVDGDLAQAMGRGGRAELRLTIKAGSQRKTMVQTFSLDGFAEIYRKLQTECEPVPQFSR